MLTCKFFIIEKMKEKNIKSLEKHQTFLSFPIFSSTSSSSISWNHLHHFFVYFKLSSNWHLPLLHRMRFNCQMLMIFILAMFCHFLRYKACLSLLTINLSSFKKNKSLHETVSMSIFIFKKKKKNFTNAYSKNYRQDVPLQSSIADIAADPINFNKPIVQTSAKLGRLRAIGHQIR